MNEHKKLTTENPATIRHLQGEKEVKGFEDFQYIPDHLPTEGNFELLDPLQSNWDLVTEYQDLMGVTLYSGSESPKHSLRRIREAAKRIRNTWHLETMHVHRQKPPYEKRVDPTHRTVGLIVGLLCGNAFGDELGGSTPEILKNQSSTPTEEVDLEPNDIRLGTTTINGWFAVKLIEHITQNSGFNASVWADDLVEWSKTQSLSLDPITERSMYFLHQGISPENAGSKALDDLEGKQSSTEGIFVRCAPLAIAYPDRPEILTEKTLELTHITHADPHCTYGCAALNLVLARLIRKGGGRPFDYALENLPSDAPNELIDMLESLSENKRRDPGELPPPLTHLYLALGSGVSSNHAEQTIINTFHARQDRSALPAIVGAIVGAKFGHRYGRGGGSTLKDSFDVDSLALKWEDSITVDVPKADSDDQHTIRSVSLIAEQALELPQLIEQIKPENTDGN